MAVGPDQLPTKDLDQGSDIVMPFFCFAVRLLFNRCIRDTSLLPEMWPYVSELSPYLDTNELTDTTSWVLNSKRGRQGGASVGSGWSGLGESPEAHQPQPAISIY
jgi:hypothetical protein